jgi:hypothetical protein
VAIHALLARMDQGSDFRARQIRTEITWENLSTNCHKITEFCLIHIAGSGTASTRAGSGNEDEGRVLDSISNMVINIIIYLYYHIILYCGCITSLTSLVTRSQTRSWRDEKKEQLCKQGCKQVNTALTPERPVNTPA